MEAAGEPRPGGRGPAGAAVGRGQPKAGGGGLGEGRPGRAPLSLGRGCPRVAAVSARLREGGLSFGSSGAGCTLITAGKMTELHETRFLHL